MSGVRLLAAHQARRLRAALARPQPGVLLGVLIPVLLLLAALWTAAEQARFPVHGIEGAALLGALLAGVPAFLAYGVLFRPADDGFLRRLGFAPAALAASRAVLLLLPSLLAALLTVVPALRLGDPLGRPVALALGAASAGWAFSLLAFGRAARATVLPRAGVPWVWRLSGGWDRELAAAAPLVYAPLVPLLLTPLVLGWAGAASGAPWGRVAAVGAAVLALGAWSLRPLASALPRFAPRALEMAFEPLADDHHGALVHDRGVARLLPRGVALARARDSVIGQRRFGWATRVVWPVAVVGIVAVARWGGEPQVRGWVVAVAGAVLLLQGVAVVGLGRLERGGRRWIDRSLGLGRAARFGGRWAWAFGMALWMLIPLSLAWRAWVPGGAAWPWFAAAAATGAAASAASLLAAGR